MNIKKNQYSSITYLVFIFIIMISFNILFPLYGDDWLYSFIYGTKDRVENVKDIFYSQYIHYFTWGGRSVAHTIAQSLLSLNKYIADFLNASVYVILVYVIYVISKNSFKLGSVIPLVIINSLLVICLPEFSETTIWKTVSSNYLWTTVIVLFFLIPYIFSIYNKLIVQNGFTVIMFLGGIIAGWTNENVGSTLIISICIFIFLFKRRYSKVPLWAISGLIGVIIGFSIMILAPGNYLRINKGYLDDPNFSYFYYYLNRFFITIKQYTLLVLPLTIGYFISLIIYNLSNKSKDKNLVCIANIFMIMSQLSAFIMFFSPIIPERTMFSSIVFLIVGISVLLSRTKILKKEMKSIVYLIVFGLIVMSCYQYFAVYKDAILMNKVMKERDLIVESSVKNNIYDVTFIGKSMIFCTSSYSDISSDSTNWENITYAQYKNINTVVLQESQK